MQKEHKKDTWYGLRKARKAYESSCNLLGEGTGKVL